MKMTPDVEETVRCTASGCSCVCFKPGSVQLRSCDRCGHSWVAHALEKLQLQAQPPSSCGPVEVALPGLVFDLSSLVLYGAQAIPVRLKILLDRLYSILTPEQVGYILHTLGWSLGDYVRGYMMQYPTGKVLDRWLMVTPEEELLILKQFLRFGETRPIVELMTLQCLAAVNRLSDPDLNPTSKSQPNISTFTEQNRGTAGVLRTTRGDPCLAAGIGRFQKNIPDHSNTVHHYENFPGGQSLLLPFHFPSSTLHRLVPPTKELIPPSKLTQWLRKPSVTKLAERLQLEEGRKERDNDRTLQRSRAEPVLKIKADPDKPKLTWSLWHQSTHFCNDQEFDLHRGVAKQENTSSLSPSSSLIPNSSSLHPSISPPPKKDLQSSSSYSLNPLPSFSSSFLCPIPSSSFSSSFSPLPSSSSSLRPLPSSLCSLPSVSPSGGRKGRVCCGVCGKSFYDKGTLKIHYNAVHLKIKHRCTVAGCTMVFSSLRSRNRHSANPNPRLHTGASRDAHAHRNTDPHAFMHSETKIQKDSRKNLHNTQTRMCNDKDALWQRDGDAHTLVRIHTLRNGHTNPPQDCQDTAQANSPPTSPYPLRQDVNQNFTLCGPTHRTDHEALPPPRHLPPHTASSLGSPPSLLPPAVSVMEKTERCRRLFSCHTTPSPLPSPDPITVPSCRSQAVSPDYDVTEGRRGEAGIGPLTNHVQRWESGDAVPKKKPRKSSMPVKIEREKVEVTKNEEEEE